MLRPILLTLLASLFIEAKSVAAEVRPATRIIRLTLPVAIERALAKNFSLEVQRYEPQIARAGVTREIGRFDPTFDISFRRAEDSTSSVFSETSTVGPNGEIRTTRRHTPADSFSRTDSLSAGIGGITPIGTSYDFGLRNDYAAGTFDRLQESSSEFSFSLNQPLLRGFGPDANLASLRIAKNNVLVSEWQLRQRVIDVITQVVFTYNDLHAARESLDVAIKSRELARQLLEDNMKRAEIGVMSPLNITTARAEVAAREEGVIVAQRAVKDQENFLKQLVTDDIVSLLNVSIEIAQPPFVPFQADVHKGLRDALELRPDYRQAKLEIERRNIQLKFANNQRLPRLDLQGSLRLLGFDNDFGTSVDRTIRRDQTGWTAGAIFSVPLPNNEGRGAVVAAKLSSAQSLVNLQRLEQQIVVDVDNASGQIVTARERIQSTAEATRLAKESLDAGQERLKAGTGTTFEVLELQENLVSAEFAELRARSDYNKAVAEYYRQTGTTLQRYNVKVE